jgi:hypothetical protein
METARARQILLNARAVELISHDLPNQTAQSAAANETRPWIIAPVDSGEASDSG